MNMMPVASANSGKKVIANAMLELPSTSDPKPYLVSDDGEGSFHVVKVMDSTDVTAWKVKCGWRFGRSAYKREAQIPVDPLFSKMIWGRCLPVTRAANKAKWEAS